MRQVQQDFLDAITFRYDDETRRTMLKIFAHKETLLDADLLEEHLVNQPLLGCIILLLLFLSLTSLIFVIVFVSCRALGNCGAKRYQPHPTSGRSYAVLCFVFLISWLVMAISASFFIQAGAAFWNPKVPKEFDEDHMIIRRNVSGHFIEAHRIEKRAASTMKPMAKMSIFDLFGDADYQGDFEQTETSSTTVSSFVTASIAPEDRPIPISRTNKKRVSTTNVVVKRPIVESVDVSTGKSAESDDVPPAVDKLPIRKIEVETTARPLKKFEIPARPMAELEFARHFDHAVSRPIIQAPFVSDTWSKAAFSSSLQQKKKLSIQPLSPPVAILGENTLESENSEEEEEADDEEHSLSTPVLEVMTSSTPQSIRNDVTEPSTTASSTTVSASPVTTTSSTTSTTTTPLLMNDVNDDVINNKNDVMDESQDAIESTETVPSSSKSIEVTTATVEEVDDDVMLSSSSDVIFKESDVMHANDDGELSTIEPVFDANVRESMESVGPSRNVDDVMTTDLSSAIPTTTARTAATGGIAVISTSTEENQSFKEIRKETTEKQDVEATSTASVTAGTEEIEQNSHSEDQEDFVLTAETSSRAPDTEIPSSTAAPMTSSTSEMMSPSTEVTSSIVPTTEEEAPEKEKETTPSRIVQFTIDEEEMTSPVVIEMTSPAVEMTSEETEGTTTEETTTVRITTSEEDKVTFLTTTEEPIGIEEIEEEDKEEVLHFVPIPTEPKPEEWQPITETPRTETSVGVFPSVPLKPDVSHGKVEQLATPLLYPYRLLHTTGILWLSRVSLFILGGVMVIVLLPSLILVLLGTIYYKSTQHPIDRRKTSDQIGQLVVILSTFLLFTLPLMFIFVQIMLTYNHLHNAVCPTLQLKYQQDLGILGQINTLTPESREIFLRNTINRDNCQASQASIETMWLSCLFFCLSSIPLLISLFKLSKYYLRMKTEYYWKLNDYGTIYAKRPAMDSAQSIYGNIYGTVGPRRPTSRPPPIPVPESPSYADGPLYSDGPIYGVYQAYGRF